MRLCRDPALRVRLAIHGRQHVTAHFDAERYLGDLEKFYYLRTNSIVTETVEAMSTHAEAAKCA